MLAVAMKEFGAWLNIPHVSSLSLWMEDEFIQVTWGYVLKLHCVGTNGLYNHYIRVVALAMQPLTTLSRDLLILENPLPFGTNS